MPAEGPEVASSLLDLRDKPPGPLAPAPGALGVWELAWPTILSMLTHTLVRWVDFMMVGSLGPDALAAELQREGTEAFAKSWNDLMVRIAEKTEVLAKARQA